MLSYKLFKQLKDAGFPQYGLSNYSLCPHTIGLKPYDLPVRMMHLVDCKEIVYIPLLEEVIDELGDDFENLVRVTDIQNKKKVVWWQAYMTEKAFSKIGISCVRDCCGYECGDIPLDAVVRLYIILKQPHENI